MATGFIGTSSVAFNTAHVETTGVSRRVTVTGSTISYTCPAAGVRYAILTIDVSLAISALPANGTNGAEPRVVADIHRLNNVLGTVVHTFKMVLAPGQVWSAAATSVVYVLASNTAYPDTNAVLRASVLEVV